FVRPLRPTPRSTLFPYTTLFRSGQADLSYVYAAAKEIAPLLRGYTAVVTKSTVPVGTGREVARIIREANPDADFDIVSNPEFLRSEEHTSELQSRENLVCRLLLE